MSLALQCSISLMAEYPDDMLVLRLDLSRQEKEQLGGA